MDISRQLAADNACHGTVIAAGFQEAGRGRIRGRAWDAERGASLPFTVMLRYPRIEDIPPALTLRAGLAAAYAIEDFILSAQNNSNGEKLSINNEQLAVMVKWPNDIMIGGKKAAGILCEVNDGYAHLGIGINVMQTEFPAHLRDKAASIALAIKNGLFANNGGQVTVNSEKFAANGARYLLLEKLLARLYEELETDAGKNWKSRLEKRLFKKGGQVTFIEGAADSGKIVKGFLSGLGEGGELLIVPEDGVEAKAFVTGELIFTEQGSSTDYQKRD